MEENEESIADTMAAVMNELEAEADPESVEAEAEPEVSDQEPEVEETDVSAATEDSEDEEPEEVFQLPEHWSSDLKSRVEGLPEEAVKAIADLEGDFKRGYQERVQSISDLQQAIEPWKQSIAQRGISEADAIRTLFATQAQIEQDPLNGVLMLAQRFGVADQLQQQFAPDTDDEFADPQIKALRQQVQNLTSQLSTFQTDTQTAQQQSLQEQVNSFKNETDSEGTLKHPHFDKVRGLMAPLVNEGKSLTEAYNEVVWSVPEFRESQLKAESEAKKKEDELEKARKVKQAKKAANSIKPSGKDNSADEEADLSLGDELAAAWKELA